MAIFEIKNLKKSFGSLAVLNDVSFSLEKGEVLSIIGSSGGGKTTLLRSLNALETPDGGEIIIDGKAVFGKGADGKYGFLADVSGYMGLVFQQFNLFPQYSVLGNLTLAPRVAASRREGFKLNKKEIYKEIDDRAEQILASVGLSEKRDAYPCQLSGGQQQRVAIARALMLSPAILCFDEPTSALDPELTGEVLKVIKELKNADRTMIIVTHELEFARNVSDKIMFIHKGNVEEVGTPEEVFENPKSEQTRAFLRKE